MMSNMENLSPQTIRQVLKEMHEIATNAPEGIKVQINEVDVTDIQAILQGPAGTPYAGGAFRVKLALGKDFPATPPKAYFLTKIFHPNVAPNGEICVNTLKRDWKPDLGLKHILLTIKCLLIVPNAESALNEEAGKMLLERYDDYSSRARMITEIHAQPAKNTSPTSSTCSTASAAGAADADADSGETTTTTGIVRDDGPCSKKSAIDKKAQDQKKKEKLMKEKKRNLKRL